MSGHATIPKQPRHGEVWKRDDGRYACVLRCVRNRVVGYYLASEPDWEMPPTDILGDFEMGLRVFLVDHTFCTKAEGV